MTAMRWALAIAVAILLSALRGLAQDSRPASAPSSQPASQPAEIRSAIAVLKENNLSDDPAVLRAYLAAMPLTDEQARRADVLIKQLGADEYKQREQATKELMKMPALPVEALRKAMRDKDLEIQMRATDILKDRLENRTLVMWAICRVMTVRKYAELADDLVRALPWCAEDENLLRQASDVLAAVCTAADVPKLRPLLGRTDPAVRRAGVCALAGLVAKDAGPESVKALQEDVLGMLRDPDDQVRLVAAVAASNLGLNQSLAALVGLMDSPDADRRGRSYQLIRELTGKEMAFDPFGPQQQRAESLAEWKTWIEKDGASAKLRTPVYLDDENSYLYGNALVCTGNGRKVIELDLPGREVWSYSADHNYMVRSAQKLKNGDYLLVCGNAVIQVDRDGRTVWELQVALPLRAVRLPNGNTIVTSRCICRSLEVDQDKKVVWENKGKNGDVCAQRLPNGNTLLSTGEGVNEVTPANEVVWEYKCKPVSAQRLTNGNTLIADPGAGIATEVDHDGRILWKHAAGEKLTDAYRLRNGNTLITAGGKAVEVAPDGKEVWSQEGCTWARK